LYRAEFGTPPCPRMTGFADRKYNRPFGHGTSGARPLQRPPLGPPKQLSRSFGERIERYVCKIINSDYVENYLLRGVDRFETDTITQPLDAPG
jgi:hypothetical protein